MTAEASSYLERFLFCHSVQSGHRIKLSFTQAPSPTVLVSLCSCPAGLPSTEEEQTLRTTRGAATAKPVPSARPSRKTRGALLPGRATLHTGNPCSTPRTKNRGHEGVRPFPGSLGRGSRGMSRSGAHFFATRPLAPCHPLLPEDLRHCFLTFVSYSPLRSSAPF